MTNLPEENPDVVAANAAPPSPVTHEEPVLVLDTATEEEADVVRATLEAAGIPAFVMMPNPGAGTAMLTETVGGGTWAGGVYVAASNVETARAILNASMPTEDELAAEQEADATTLEEAEAEVRNA